MLTTEEKANLLETLAWVVDNVRRVNLIRIDLETGKIQLHTEQISGISGLCTLYEQGWSYTSLSKNTFELTPPVTDDVHTGLSVYELDIPMVTKRALVTTFGTVYRGKRRTDMSLGDLVKLTPLQLCSAYNVGKVSVYKIIRALSEHNLTLADK
jgi:hypothetical protein